jgi:hypothetical protein
VEIFARGGKQMLSSNPIRFTKTWKRDIRARIPRNLWLPTGVSGPHALAEGADGRRLLASGGALFKGQTSR